MQNNVYVTQEKKIIIITVKPVYNDYPWDPKFLLVVMLTGGRYSEVVVSSGLTVYWVRRQKVDVC